MTLTNTHAEENTMKKIGFIGLGHMGQALLRAILKSSSPALPVTVSSRTTEKLYEFKKVYPSVAIEEKSADVAIKSDLLFICVNTYEVINVMNEISQYLRTDTHIISIAGGLRIEEIEKIFKGKISKLIPTLMCEVFEGTSLICHNHYVNDDARAYLEAILGKIGSVMVIQEDQFPVYTALSSCAPGLIASIFDLLIESALKCSNIDKNHAYQIILDSLQGTSKLLQTKNESFSDLINRVARKGGNTEIGVNLFRINFPEVFDKMFLKMIANEKERNSKTAEQFKLQESGLK